MSVLEVCRSPSQNLLDINIDNLSRVLLNTAKTCTIPRVHAMTIEDVNLPFRNLLERSDKVLASFLSGATGVEDWYAARSLVIYENKKVHFGKIAERWTKLMSNQDSKELWNAINWKEEADETPTSDLASHFLTKRSAHEPVNTSDIPDNQYVEVLDKPVSIDEVYEASRLMKEKST